MLDNSLQLASEEVLRSLPIHLRSCRCPTLAVIVIILSLICWLS